MLITKLLLDYKKVIIVSGRLGVDTQNHPSTISKVKVLGGAKIQIRFQVHWCTHCQMIIWYQQSFAKINMMICKFHQNRSRDLTTFKSGESITAAVDLNFLFIHIISQKLWFNHSEWRILHQDCKKTFLTKSLFGCLYLFHRPILWQKTSKYFPSFFAKGDNTKWVLFNRLPYHNGTGTCWYYSSCIKHSLMRF